ncbi:MAG: CYTH domain-containing protein [Chloroflexota bacterium]
MTADRVEAELKYLAANEPTLRLLASAARLGPADLGRGRTVDEVDRYLDTADLRLEAVHWACRLRTRGGRTIVSLKGPAEHEAGDPLHRRAEVEGPAGPELEPGEWPDSPARDRLLVMTGGKPLVERFRLLQERTERPVSLDGEHVGLLSLDRARIVHDEIEVGRLAVVELELDPSALAAGLDHRPMADALAAIPGLAADPSSKLERALALLPRR